MKSTFQLLIMLSLLVLPSCNSNNKTKKNDSSKKVAQVTIEDVEKGIRANIAQQVKDNNGFFTYQKDTIDLSLKLVRVHTEYLSVLGPNKFFACVDLATTDGDVYDVDFFLNGTADTMTVTSTEIHKLNGKPFYTWQQQKDKSWTTVPVENASTDLLGVIEGKDEFSFYYRMMLPEIKEQAEIWIPIAKSDDYQEVEIIKIEAPVEYTLTEEDKYGNIILHANFNPEHSKKAFTIEYSVKRIEKSAYIGTVDTALHLGTTSFLPINDRFRQIADSAFKAKEATTPLTKARALYDYVIDNMRYAKQGKYGTGDAMYACDSKSGNCTEFHSFFISLARSAGIPARFAVGAAIPSERNEGGVNGYHCWAEFYAEGKWWPVDISEANKYSALATYYFGHHPANRIEFSKGRNLMPEPMPYSGPINFLAYPVFELDGEETKIETFFSFNRM